MVSADGFAKVLDFGLAKLTEKREGGAATSPRRRRSPRTAAPSGSVVGTAGYMSPEQVQGKAVDHRSDIFSFGCILYEAATRRKPFAAETGVETMHKILNEKPVPVEELNDKVPAELRRLIRRCLAKSPDQRVQSMKDLAIELREIVEEYDALSASASSASHVSGAAPSAEAGAHARAAGARGGRARSPSAGLAIGWWGLRRGASESASKPAVPEHAHVDADEPRRRDRERALARRPLPRLPRRARRARQPARAPGGDRQRRRGAADAGRRARGPGLLPDGNYLFYLARKPDNPNYRALFQVPSLGGTPRERAFDVDSRVTFSPDGKQVAFWRGSCPRSGRPARRLRPRRLAGSACSPRSATPRATRAPPAWSPDGATLAATLLQPAPDLQTTVAFFDAKSGARRDYLTLPRTIFAEPRLAARRPRPRGDAGRTCGERSTSRCS